MSITTVSPKKSMQALLNVARPKKGERALRTTKLKQQTWRTKTHTQPRALYFLPTIPIRLTGSTQGVGVSKFIPATHSP